MGVNYLTAANTAAFLGAADEYTGRITPFSLNALLGAGATEQDYCKFAAAQACEWTEAAQNAVAAAVDSLNAVILEKNLNLPLPKRLDVMLSTTEEEGGCDGYSRRGGIVLYNKMFKYAKQDYVTWLVARELFHVMMRLDSDFRDAMYGLVGFKALPCKIPMPRALKDYVIETPDCNSRDYYTTFDIDGIPCDCIMIQYSKKAYTGGAVWDYVTPGLLEIDLWARGPLYDRDGSYVLHKMDSALDFYDKVGRNTEYTVDPEEILADNFAALFTEDISEMPSPDLLQRMLEACQK